MSEYREVLKTLEDAAVRPDLQLKEYLARGRKAVGVLPYFCPEELVYAAGAVPFGLWGAERTVSEAKRYFPAFICSILQTVLEMGIRGELNGLSAIMVPICCDSLKGMGTNWEYGVPQVPVINVAWAENRKFAPGAEFTASQFRKIRGQLEGILDTKISDEAVAGAVGVYNENRAALREFTDLLREKPGLLTPLQRSRVLKAGYFMDRREHTALVRELTRALAAAPAPEFTGLRIVTTGILCDSPDLLRILEENGMAVADDQVAHESVFFREDTPVTPDPILGMARRLGLVEGCSVLYDPGKKRVSQLAETARRAKADGVLFVLTKFCDPEEYDYVPVKRALEKAGIPLLLVEVDQQMKDYEQARSAVETFRDILEARR